MTTTHRAALLRSALCLTTAKPRPSPTLFCFPGLTSRAWHEPKDFDWVSRLEANHDVIRDEFLALRDARQAAAAQAPASDYNVNDKEHQLHQGQWDWLSYVTQGRRQADFAVHCPKTVEILESIPGFMTGLPFAYAFFSVLKPQSSIKAHSAPCNLEMKHASGKKVVRLCSMTPTTMKSGTMARPGIVCFFCSISGTRISSKKNVSVYRRCLKTRVRRAGSKTRNKRAPSQKQRVDLFSVTLSSLCLLLLVTKCLGICGIELCAYSMDIWCASLSLILFPGASISLGSMLLSWSPSLLAIAINLASPFAFFLHLFPFLSSCLFFSLLQLLVEKHLRALFTHAHFDQTPLLHALLQIGEEQLIAVQTSPFIAPLVPTYELSLASHHFHLCTPTQPHFAFLVPRQICQCVLTKELPVVSHTHPNFPVTLATL